MPPLLDDEPLSGPHVARISARPFREAIGIASGDMDSFDTFVALQCQIWGGAASVALPTDANGLPDALYARRLPGSQVDQVHGHRGLDLDLSKPISLSEERYLGRAQLAAGLYPYRQTQDRAPLEIAVLEHDDPWRGIYSACLGSLPETIDSRLVQLGNWLPDIQFEDFVTVKRSAAVGSLDDLLARTWPQERVISPRQLSMTHLAYGGTASTSIRTGREVLPEPWFDRFDAGPNVVVVCTPGSTEDLALLWNLRAAHGDFYALPIGIPLDELSKETLSRIVSHGGVARHGSAVHSLYVTSATVPLDLLAEYAEDKRHGVAIRSAEAMLGLGRVGGWERDEVLIWTAGRATFQPLNWEGRRDILERRNIGDMVAFHFDLEVEDSPFPQAEGFRVNPFDGEFYAGARTTWSSIRSAHKMATVQWPSRMLMARSLGASRGFDLRESEPGKAARIMLERLGGLGYVHMLRHAPLLELLERMAARQGFSWFKERLRNVGLEAEPGEGIGAGVEELRERPFSDFKRALGNNEAAARHWVIWAEKAGLIVKGFPVQCEVCSAKQWVPVGSFVAPVSCRGCSVEIEYPFGAAHNINFKYRISEQLRRVYEVDAMGHLLVASFFEELFGHGGRSELVGLHPGLSVYDDAAREVGEADVLLLDRQGSFTPIEVKRSTAGLIPEELDKLDQLTSLLASSWSAVAVCQYAKDSGDAFPSMEVRHPVGTYQRVALSFDRLLQGNVIWGMGTDPLSLEVMTSDDIAKREKGFVDALARRASESADDWFTWSMLHHSDSKDAPDE